MAGVKKYPDVVVVQLSSIERHGSIALGTGVTETQTPVQVAIDLRYAYDLARAIGRGARPVVTVEPWSVVTALPPRTS